MAERLLAFFERTEFTCVLPCFGGVRVVKVTTKEAAGASVTDEFRYDCRGALTDVLRGSTVIEHYDYQASSNSGHNRTAATTASGTISGITTDQRDRLLTYGSLIFLFSEYGEQDKYRYIASHFVQLRSAW